MAVLINVFLKIKTILRDRLADRQVRDLAGFPLILFQGLSERDNMTPKKEETKLILDILKALEAEELQKASNSIKGAVLGPVVSRRLQVASKETASINGRENFYRVLADSCVHVPDKRTKQEKKNDEEFWKKVIDYYIENQYIVKDSPIEKDTKILNQIKDLNFFKVILIIGENVVLAEPVAYCISSTYLKFYCPTLHKLSGIDGKYTVRKPGFKSQSYVGWDEVDIKDHLFLSQNPKPLIDHFKEGDILFLRGINDKKTLERLIDTEREYRFRHGLLIINTKKADIISQEFLDQTEKIYLKASISDSTSTSPPQDTSQGKKRNELFYNYNKQDKLTLFVKKDKFITLTENEAKLFLFLAKDRRTQEEIAEHVWEVYNKKDIHTKKGNAMELRNRLNKKCSKIGIENLISPLVDGCYCLNLEVEER